MRQRLPFYILAVLVWAGAYSLFQVLHWFTVANIVLLALVPGIGVVVAIEGHVAEREQGEEVPEHEGWRDGDHVRQVLGVPAEAPVPSIEEQARAAAVQQSAVDDDITDRYTAMQEAAMREIEAIAAGVGVLR